MKRTNARLILGLCFLLTLLLQVAVFGQLASAQTPENTPVPEYYGVYAVIDGKLYGIGVPRSTINPERIPVPIGVNTGRAVAEGAQPARVSQLLLPLFPSNVQFLVFEQKEAMRVPKHLTLGRWTFVRNISVDTGWPNGVRREGQENAWDGGQTGGSSAIDSLGTSWHLVYRVKMLSKPVQGHPEMVLAVPSAPLNPGVYGLWIGDPSSSRPEIFVVNPVKEGEQPNCMDVEYIYTLVTDVVNVKTSPCAATASPAMRQTRKAEIEKAAVPSSEYPLAGFWKNQCSENFGLAIAPARDGYYSVSFCGPGGCAEPGTYRPNSKIVNDPDYQVIDNDAVGVSVKNGGFARYLRCPILTEAAPSSKGPLPSAERPANPPLSAPRPSAPFEAQAVWDKALEAGEVSFVVYRERFASSQKGSLRLTPTEVSFIDQKGQKIFAVPPSDISSSKVFSTTPVGISSSWLEQHSLTLDSIPGVGLSIAGKNYNFEPFPLQAGCELQASFVLCPEPGRQQQSVIANYVTHTIPKLASGGFAKTGQLPTPKAGCDAATDLGYSLLAGGHLYKVKGIASSSGGQVHVFFDEKSALVQDPNLLLKLVLGAWTREKIVKNSTARNGSTRISALLSASTIVARDTALADLAARGMTEALEAYLTGGASLSKAVPNLTAGTLKGLLVNSPRTLLWLAGRRGLESSREKYELLAKILPPQDEAAFDVTTLEAVRRLYTEADGLELPNAALLTAMMPMTVMDNLKDLAGSVLSEVLPGVPNPSEAVTLDGLLKLQKSIANYGRGRSELQAYSQSLDQVLRLAAEENTVIGSWAQNAAGACQP